MDDPQRGGLLSPVGISPDAGPATDTDTDTDNNTENDNDRDHDNKHDIHSDIHSAGWLTLPEVLDMVAAAPLLEAFLGRRGQPLQIDGAAVQRLGGQCLQVLLAARAAWAADGQSFVLGTASEELFSTLELLGLTPQSLTYHA
jgi:chemotaxis protein CheX